MSLSTYFVVIGVPILDAWYRDALIYSMAMYVHHLQGRNVQWMLTGVPPQSLNTTVVDSSMDVDESGISNSVHAAVGDVITRQTCGSRVLSTQNFRRALRQIMVPLKHQSREPCSIEKCKWLHLRCGRKLSSSAVNSVISNILYIL